MAIKAPKIFVISAPSGCGKTTLSKRLLTDKSLGLKNSISVTTRCPREGEKDGRDYIFVSRRKFRAMEKKREFLEREENFGNLYGTPKKYVEGIIDNGASALLSIDVKGAMNVRKAYPDKSVLIFVLPPSRKALEERLKKRNSESKEDMRARLHIAEKELSYKSKYDYRIINDRIDHAYKRLKKIIKKELNSGG